MTERVTSGLMRGRWRRSDGPLEGDTRPKRGETARPRTPCTPPRLRPTLLILLELAFISGRPKDTRLALLKELNARIVAGAGISPDDVMIQLTEAPGENFSFGQGLAQRAAISPAA
jgi:Tautomerase enzyme